MGTLLSRMRHLQIKVNLIKNRCDAFVEGGSISAVKIWFFKVLKMFLGIFLFQYAFLSRIPSFFLSLYYWTKFGSSLKSALIYHRSRKTEPSCYKFWMNYILFWKIFFFRWIIFYKRFSSMIKFQKGQETHDEILKQDEKPKLIRFLVLWSRSNEKVSRRGHAVK